MVNILVVHYNLYFFTIVVVIIFLEFFVNVKEIR